MNNWIYKGKEFIDTPKEYESFVYMIINETKNKFYIGKKNFWKTIKYNPLKGNKNKRWKEVESDWREYISSSEALQNDLKTDKFHREILILCSKKSIATYFELYLQMHENVLFDDTSYNNIINIRLNGNIFKNHKDEIRRILKEIEGKNIC